MPALRTAPRDLAIGRRPGPRLPGRAGRRAVLALMLLGAGCQARFVDQIPDAGPAGDFSLGGISLSGDGGERIVSTGEFVGLAGYSCAGQATLVQHGGELLVILGTDFAVAGVPDAHLVLSRQAALSTTLDPAVPAEDQDLGPLRGDQGAQVYAAGPLPSGGAGAAPPDAFVYGALLGIAACRAVLVASP